MRHSFLILSGSAVMAIVACAQGGGRTGAASALGPAAAEPPKPVTVNYGMTSPLATYWVSFVAMDKGFFEKQGINIEVVRTESSVRTTAALAGGSIEFANNSPDSTILAVEKGADLLVVAEEVSKPVYSLIAHPDFKSVPALKGKKVGVADMKSGATMILRKTLAFYGLKDEDYELVAAGGTGARYAALKAGGIDAAPMIQPQDFQAMDAGFSRVAVSTDAVKDFVFNSVVVQRPWARQNPDVVVRFVRGFRQAADWLYDPKNKEDAIAILVKNAKQEDKYARLTYELAVEQVKMFAPSGKITVSGIKTVIDTLGELGELRPPLPPAEKYVDTSYWEKAGR